MSRYGDNRDAVRDRAHRDVYIDPELFPLEQEHFFANTWNYVGYESKKRDTGPSAHRTRPDKGVRPPRLSWPIHKGDKS